MARKATEFDIDEAKRLLKETNSWRATAKVLGIHPYTLQRKFISLDIDIDRTLTRRRWDFKKAKRLRDNGMTYQHIANVMKVNVSTVYRALKRGK